MKILVFFCLLGLVLADDDWWNPTKKYGKWAKMQAMKVCYGEKAMEQWHVKHKKALKKCTGMPVPELEMWEKTKPYRMVHSMLKGLKEKNQGAMMEMMQKMHGANQANQQAQVHVVTVPQQENNMMTMMKMMMMKKMMKKMMHGHHGGDMDEDDEDKMSMYKMDDSDDMTGFEKFFDMMKQSQGRYKRDADLYDLGDRLHRRGHEPRPPGYAQGVGLLRLERQRLAQGQEQAGCQGLLRHGPGNAHQHTRALWRCQDDEGEEDDDVLRHAQEDGVHVQRRQADA